jgi:hypothetical protein
MWGIKVKETDVPSLGVAPQVLDLKQRDDGEDLLGAAEVEGREQHLGQARLHGELCDGRDKSIIVIQHITKEEGSGPREA